MTTRNGSSEACVGEHNITGEGLTCTNVGAKFDVVNPNSIAGENRALTAERERDRLTAAMAH